MFVTLLSFFIAFGVWTLVRPTAADSPHPLCDTDWLYADAWNNEWMVLSR
jgi:hypothetical protein